MRLDVARDLSKSAAAFQDVVWPVISPELGGGELVPVESVTATSFAKALDMLAGVDAWQVCSTDGRMRGIASRVQWISSDSKPWNSFTIRKSRATGATTEYEKRIYALKSIREGWVFPGLTVQAYLSSQSNELLSVAAIKTYDLFAHVLKGRRGVDYTERPNRQDGNVFIAVFWDVLRKSGVDVVIPEKQAA